MDSKKLIYNRTINKDKKNPKLFSAHTKQNSEVLLHIITMHCYCCCILPSISEKHQKLAQSELDKNAVTFQNHTTKQENKDGDLRAYYH
jgi:hypothetical protein